MWTYTYTIDHNTLVIWHRSIQYALSCNDGETRTKILTDIFNDIKTIIEQPIHKEEPKKEIITVVEKTNKSWW